jgi:hypothetical protein
MIRYPLGGMVCHSLQWLHGLHTLGHDICLVEKANYPNACFNPSTFSMDDDGSYGVKIISTLLKRIGIEGRFCFVDYHNNYHGLSKAQVQGLFATADLFIDNGNHGAWLPETAAGIGPRIYIDGEPGYRQVWLMKEKAEGRRPLAGFDHYYTVGQNIGTSRSPAPTAGLTWRHLFHPICLELFDHAPAPRDAPFTTVMNWQAHQPVEYEGVIYGQKDIEFEKFFSLPSRTNVPLEVAVAGKVPMERLSEAGWRTKPAHDVTISHDSFLQYVRGSRGEFSICKNVFVAMSTGWFSDRSAAYLASGRPVVLQDTGFSAHLPCGRGLFAVKSVEEAAVAIEMIEVDYDQHSKRAREIAHEYFDIRKVAGHLLGELGV